MAKLTIFSKPGLIVSFRQFHIPQVALGIPYQYEHVPGQQKYQPRQQKPLIRQVWIWPFIVHFVSFKTNNYCIISLPPFPCPVWRSCTSFFYGTFSASRSSFLCLAIQCVTWLFYPFNRSLKWLRSQCNGLLLGLIYNN